MKTGMGLQCRSSWSDFNHGLVLFMARANLNKVEYEKHYLPAVRAGAELASIKIISFSLHSTY
jgi:hypothetical protein